MDLMLANALCDKDVMAFDDKSLWKHKYNKNNCNDNDNNNDNDNDNNNGSVNSKNGEPLGGISLQLWT